MKLVKVVKTHKTKEGKEFKKAHFYLYLTDEIKTEILPSDFKTSKGYYNNQSSDILNLFAQKQDKE